ncbi:hypothetical protein TWF106_004478 [Orbilia oligospora]|uniref:Methyltransferase domain-containing protein n=1 Tax=Orbilia oligospora TaxID=2813651 RepID=A0A6G1M010_ORBOL|nr:hypothetical protein TWF788_011562 [Orbilia oligospora]KAF3198735.1 hypothetical protein TWF106_004478 [Orbilia oligospora]KAF3240546.1 hypothetical protein TWF192_009446 [Orbilia oligospora]
MDFSGFIYTCPSSQYLDKSTCIAKMMEPGLSPAFQYQRPAAHRERLVPVPLTTLPDGILPLSPTLTSTSTVTATGAIPLAAKKEPQKYFMGRPVHPNYHYKKNRRYAGDESIPYPLPCDQQEVNRQNLIHHIFNEVFGTIHAAEFPRFEDIPSKVLDVGCGSGLWIASMSDEFAARGKPNVQFTGLDIVRNCPDMAGVNFRFVKHNILNLPLPFATGEFDYIMVREMTLCCPQDLRSSEALLEEYLRVLRVGGILEVQCSDHTIRCLSPSSIPPSSRSGAYPMTASTRFNHKSENSYIQDYNRWISHFLGTKHLPTMPCTSQQSTMAMEKSLKHIRNRRYALPLDNPHWEGKPLSLVTGTLENRSLTSLTSMMEPRRSTESSKSAPQAATATNNISNDTETRSIESEPRERKGSMEMFVSDDARGLRILARQTFTSLIRNLEPVLRQSNKIPQEDWDWWFRDLMLNFHQNRGLNGGECIEIGAWWGVKRST